MIILDIFIGLVLVYFLYSLLVSIIAEMLSTWMGMRARMLRQGIENLLNDKKQVKKFSGFLDRLFYSDFSQWQKDVLLIESEDFKFTNAGKFYQQPSIKYMAKAGESKRYSIRNTKPSYISAQNFTDTILNMLSTKGKGINEWEKIKFSIEHNTLNLEPETHKMVSNWLARANDSYQNFMKLAALSFDEMMDRVNGWYKRKIGLIIFWLGFVVCLAFNVDTFQTVRILRDDPKTREQSLAIANKLTVNTLVTEKKDSVSIDSLKKELQNHLEVINNHNSMMGSGWAFPAGTTTYLQKIKFIIFDGLWKNWRVLGILITALALSMGSQFWFDLLKKLIAIRGAGIKPEEKDGPNSKPILPISNVDGLALTNANPAAIIISKNLRNWEKTNGFVAANKALDAQNNEIVELIFEPNKQPANLPKSLMVTIDNQNISVPIHTKTANKAKLGLSTADVPFGALVQQSTNSWGSPAGIVFNKRTKQNAILTCAHVVRTDNSAFIDTNKEQILINDRGTLQQIGAVRNSVMSVFCDAGLVDINPQKLGLLSHIPKISTFRKVNANEKGLSKVIIKGLGGDKSGLLVNTSMHFTFIDAGNNDVRYFDLLLLGENTSNFANPISKPGDSGSLITDSAGIPIGILVGGGIINGQHFSFGIKLDDIFDIMQIETINT